ncbi:MAG: efflux RND transporter periplasmic adaptor subunit [Microscillaceae bacterium]|nr:efflux RND transporter periplasmic adaptor subunit [Microscillaceae bacterium]
MKHYLKYAFLIFTLILAACGGAKKDEVTTKKDLLKEKKKAMDQLKAEILILEKEISKLDPTFVSENVNVRLVTTLDVNSGSFASFQEVQGTVESDNNVVLSSETNGIVRTIAVSEGQYVGAGQLLVSQDSQVLLNNIEEVKKALELAEVRYNRQKNLWDQKIGTEFQYLETKNNMERLQKQLNTLKSQVNMSNTTAPFAGYVDEIYIKRGQNAGPGTELLRLVSLSQVNVVAEVSEAYLTKVKRGDMVKVHFASIDVEQEAPITLVGQTINPDNRTFRIEIRVNNPNGLIKPDLLATVKIKEEDKPSVIVVPTDLIQDDTIGDFVFIVDKQDNKMVARKIRVARGETYNNQTIIKEGLKGGEKLINKGFRDVVDGSLIEIEGEDKQKVAKK